VTAGITVLLVEDNDKNMKLARDLLAHRGVVVVPATCGAEALAVAATSGAQVVLLDVDLPDMPGTDVLGPLRTALPGIPVVAVTAYAMKGDRERLLEAGFDAYISKPIDVRSFADTVLGLAAP
jgi:two-component system, cell cycle response regulator DivK